MAKKTEETSLGTPVKYAHLYEIVGAAGFPSTKTLTATEKTKMWRTDDATLLIQHNNQMHEIRNYKLLIYA